LQILLILDSICIKLCVVVVAVVEFGEQAHLPLRKQGCYDGRPVALAIASTDFTVIEMLNYGWSGTPCIVFDI